jgi:hypothetical protein
MIEAVDEARHHRSRSKSAQATGAQLRTAKCTPTMRGKERWTDDVKVKEWPAIRKREALKIDPETARLRYAQLDPTESINLSRNTISESFGNATTSGSGLAICRTRR